MICFGKYRIKMVPVVSLFSLLICSCGTGRNKDIETGTPLLVKLDTVVRHYPITDYVYDLQLVDLEYGDSSVISAPWSVHSLLYRGGKYFLMDDKFMAVKVFNEAGKYLYDIGRLGQGSGEFIRIVDIKYNVLHNTIMVLCNNPRKIAEYTLDGGFVRDEHLDFWATSLSCPSNDTRMFYVNQNRSPQSLDKSILITDTLNRIRGRLFDAPRDINAVISFSGGLFTEDGGIYFNPAFSNTYYTIVSGLVQPVFRVDFGSRNIPENFPANKLMEDLAKYCFLYSTFSKDSNYIGFNYINKGLLSAFCDIHSGNVLTSEPGLDSLNLFFSNPVFNCGGQYVMTVDMQALTPFIRRNRELIKKRMPELLNHTVSDKPNQNPVLLIFKLKAFYS